jgi:hypothetical protein
LHRRIATALEEQEPTAASRVRRSIILGSVLVAGAAMATTLGLGPASPERMCPRA